VTRRRRKAPPSGPNFFEEKDLARGPLRETRRRELGGEGELWSDEDVLYTPTEDEDDA
jgi:hypothetical protein